MLRFVFAILVLFVNAMLVVADEPRSRYVDVTTLNDVTVKSHIAFKPVNFSPVGTPCAECKIYSLHSIKLRVIEKTRPMSQTPDLMTVKVEMEGQNCYRKAKGIAIITYKQDTDTNLWQVDRIDGTGMQWSNAPIPKAGSESSR